MSDDLWLIEYTPISEIKTGDTLVDPSTIDEERDKWVNYKITDIQRNGTSFVVELDSQTRVILDDSCDVIRRLR